MASAVIDVARFNPTDEGFLDDPYKAFAHYRAIDPVHWGHSNMRNLPGSWYLFRYEENAEVLGNAELFANDPGTAGQQSSIPEVFRPVASTFQRWLGGRDGVDHKRLRSVLAKAFTPSRITAFRPRVEAITSQLIGSLHKQADGTFDLMREFAFPLPMAIVGDTLGVPSQDWHLFQSWSADLSRAIEDPADAERAAAGGIAISKMVEYFQQLMARRRVEPTDDLLCAMMTEADNSGQPLDERDILAVATELGFAGHETTTNSIGKSILGLMAQRDQWEELKGLTGAGLDKAVDELLRWTCPVQRQRWRWATSDTVVAGKDIRRGESVVSVLAAANRDPNHFPEPDRIDFHRSGGRHMTFGFGNHFCLGHQLAKMELRTVLSALVTQFPDMSLAEDPARIPWKRHFGLPAPKIVPIRA